MYTCPCCGYETFSEPPGSYEICDICFWEDDIVQLEFPDLAGGANDCSLIEGQHNFEQFGVCKVRHKSLARAPAKADTRNSKWRLLDPTKDRYLKWENRDDHNRWQAVKDSSGICLYYWLPEYWLA